MMKVLSYSLIHYISNPAQKFMESSKPNQDHESEFEFGSITPRSPNSPADHLFSNGRLLPHDFPCPPAKPVSFNLPRSMSRTSSVGSKDSLMSSRSNSTNSRSSTSSCSTSARTSSSDVSERKILVSKAKSTKRKAVAIDMYQAPNKPGLLPQKGSQKQQYITQTPILMRKVSRRNKAETGVQQASKGEKHAEGKKNRSPGIFWRFFMWFVSACNECHALKPSKIETAFQGSI